MAQLSLPTSAEIWTKASSKLTFAHFNGTTTDADVISKIETEIRPNIIKRLNNAVDKAALPHDFPFTDAFLLSVYPTWTASQRDDEVSTQQGDLSTASMHFALSELFSDVCSVDPVYVNEANRQKALGEEALKRAIGSIKATASLTPESQEQEGMTSPRSHSVRVRPRFGW